MGSSQSQMITPWGYPIDLEPGFKPVALRDADEFSEFIIAAKGSEVVFYFPKPGRWFGHYTERREALHQANVRIGDFYVPDGYKNRHPLFLVSKDRKVAKFVGYLPHLGRYQNIEVKQGEIIVTQISGLSRDERKFEFDNSFFVY